MEITAEQREMAEARDRALAKEMQLKQYNE